MAKNPPKAKLPKRPVPLNEVEEHLREQLGFLEKSIREFDAGDSSEFKRMAATIRVLLYDGPTSHSVAGQLGLKIGKFTASGKKFDPSNLVSEWCLAIIRMDESGATFIPAFNESNPPRLVDFDTWWDEPVLKDEDNTILSRGDLILVVANQAGGSHVDPAIDERYHRLAKEHSIGMMFGRGMPGNGSGVPLENIEKVYLRHIAFEVVETLKPRLNALLGNRPCECGSGRKARYCCLKTTRS